MKIYFDFTKTAGKSENSGVHRMARRLLAEFRKVTTGDKVIPICWLKKQQCFVRWPYTLFKKQVVVPEAGTIFLTPYFFNERERPGWSAFMQNCQAVKTAIYHDAIPLKFPECTWPGSVERHPQYMKELASFDLVLPVSIESQTELLDYWKWLGITPRANTRVFPSGSDLDGSPRSAPCPWQENRRDILCIGILEPRKNHAVLMDACQSLWDKGERFTLHLAGRINPHFGEPIANRVAAMRKSGYTIEHHLGAGDHAMLELYKKCRATAFLSYAEGNGLPVQESLWHGIPVVCSAVPSANLIGQNQGIVIVDHTNPTAVAEALKSVLTNQDIHRSLTNALAALPLPTWEDSARAIVSLCKAQAALSQG